MPSMPRLSPNAHADRILEGNDHAVDSQAMLAFLLGDVDTWELMNAADRVRRGRFGNRVHLCSIVNAKEGGCPEDCAFCSQSRHHATHVGAQRFTSIEDILAAGRRARSHGAESLGLVTAIRGLEDGSRALSHIVEAVRALRDIGFSEIHGSLGFLSEAALGELIEAGLTEVNHNLETGRSYFEKIVTTHSYEERLAAIRSAQAKGVRTCVGGLFGMGETPEHRLELAADLRELDVDEVPLNFLVSIDGTRPEKVEPMAPLEILHTIACFRLFLPRQNVIVAAGRTHIGQLVPLIFGAGASGMMIGDFLTTPNRTAREDLLMLDEIGLVGLPCGGGRPNLEGREDGDPARLSGLG
jgi:biotin synthase